MAQINVKVLITDRFARCLGEGSDNYDLERMTDIVCEAVRYEKVQAMEIRTFTFDVELLKAPEKKDVEVSSEISVSPELRTAIDAVLKEKGISDREQAWDMLMDALPDGSYQMERRPGMRSLKKID